MQDIRSIIFFGDASQDPDAAFEDFLLALADDTLVSKFVHNVHETLRTECLKLSPLERADLPHLDDVHCLFRSSREGKPLHPALHAAKVVTLQLGSFLAVYEQSYEQYPAATDNIAVGVCLGELSAVAVSLANSLLELVPYAVESVRVAFKTGLAAFRTARELELPASPYRSWSLVTPRESGVAEPDALDRIQSSIGSPHRNRAWISAYSTNTVTLSGPPETLRQVTERLENDRFLKLPINVPYHAQHLYTSETITVVLDAAPLRATYHSSQFESARRTHISGSDGAFCSANSPKALLEEAVRHILISPMDWKRMSQGCRDALAVSPAGPWSFRPFGPTSSLENLVSSLNNDGAFKVSLDDSLWKGALAQAKPSRAPLAIVGMAGRFPQANTPDELWHVLAKGKDCHTEIPKDRFDSETHLSQPAFGCFIDGPGLFDARFFSMSPREALQTEPGQRLSLTTAYEALEMAGFVPNRTASTQLGRIGTFYGQTVDEYKEQNMSQDVGTYFIPGSLRAFGPGRINRHFKFGGPASSIDTACSSSSVALHAACSAIWNDECDMAVAGGANILSSSDNYVGLSAGHFLSSTGGCKTFDDAADGYCRAEAVASVVIKRLDAAEADNDNILGVILSAATNYSAEAISITHPHSETQKSLYKQVVDMAGIRPFDVDYVEMHGTGTQAGDACEMESVTAIFAPTQPSRRKDLPLWISAVKANIGHSEAASGITSLIKSLLVLREELLPPHIGIQGALNRNFPKLSERNVRIPFEATPLPTKANVRSKRRVLINNFGAAGGNTAMIIEEAPKVNEVTVQDDRRDHVINITAKAPKSLRGNMQNMLRYLKSNPTVPLSNLSYTTTARRIQHRLRISVVCSTVPELTASLESLMPSEDFKTPEKDPKVVFAFTGQGTFYTSLGIDLYRSCSTFRASIVRLNSIATDHGFPSFLPIVDGDAEEDVRPSQIHLSILAVQISLCNLWASLGVRPGLVAGHSLGEYAALYASGVLTSSDAIYLVGKRAELLENELQAGTHAMLAVRAPSTTISEMLEQSIEVACINGPSDTVLSGPARVISDACERLQSHGLKCKFLSMPYAFHSSQIDPILDKFEALARGVSFGTPTCPLISPLLGEVVQDAGVVDASYLRLQTRGTVNFAGAIQTAQVCGLVDANSIWVDIGPHPLCAVMVRSTLGANVKAIPTFQKTETSLRSMARATSALSSLGIDINWTQYHRDYDSAHKLLILPSYHFDEKNYWMEYKNDWLLTKTQLPSSQLINTSEIGPATTTVQKLVSQNFAGGNQLSMLFESDMSDVDLHAAIIGHSVNGSGLLPASIYSDMAMTVARYVREKHSRSAGDGMDVTAMTITHPVVVPLARSTKPDLLRMAASADLNTGHMEIAFGQHDIVKDKTDWKAKCTVIFGDGKIWTHQWSNIAYLIETRIQRLEQGVMDGNTHKLLRGMVYRLFASCVDYDIKYQAMQEVLLDSEGLEAAARLNLFPGSEGGSYFCSPFWIDAFVHLAGFVMNANDTVDTRDAVYISSGWRSMRFAETIDASLPYRVHVKMIPEGEKSVSGDVSVLQGSRIVAYISDLKFQRVPRTVLNFIMPPSSANRTPAVSQAAAKLIPSSTVHRHPQVHERIWRELPQLSTPTSRHADRVFETIAEEVGITIPEIHDIDRFDEMGVDSLLSLQIVARLQDALGRTFDSHLFQTYPTAKDLKRYLEGQEHGLEDMPSDTSGSNTDTEDLLSTLYSPAEDISPLVYSTIAEQLGVEVQELLEVQDLSELGLDSLMGIQIIATLQERFGVVIELTALTGSTTLASIEKMMGVTPPSPTETLPGAKAFQPLSMTLQRGSNPTERTVFLFPDGSGSPAIYSYMKLTPGHHVVALQSPFVRDPLAFEESIESMAERWVAEIRRRQQSGPYVLLGYSAGGYYAFEAARQLLATGSEIDHLFLIDSPSPTLYEAMPASLPKLLSERGILATDETNAQHFVATIRAVQAYHPNPLPGAASYRTTIFWASHGAAPDLDAETLPLETPFTGITQWLLQRPSVNTLQADGWEKLLPGRDIDIKVTPGHHFNLLKEPNCTELGRHIDNSFSTMA